VQIKIENRQKFLLIVALTILGLFVATSVIYEPLKANWIARSKRIADLKEKVAYDNHLLRRRTEILARWDNMKNNVLPPNSSQAGSALLKAKDRWVEKSGVGIEDFSPQLKQDTDPDSSDVITTWECRTDASGGMHSILNFLWSIESDPMGVQLEDIELSSKDNSGEEMTLGLTLSALVLDNGQSRTSSSP
jgi:hypothetical protein